MENLQKVTGALKEASSPEEKAAFLDQAFELFKEETERLAKAYWSLQKKFEAVNLELQGTNQKLKIKIEELRFTTNYLDSILSQMAQGLLFIDQAGTITTFNQAAETILGSHEKADVLLKSYWTLFPDELFGFSLRRALGEKKAPPIAYSSIKNKEGVLSEIEVGTSFIQNGTLQGIIILLRDITELRHLQVLAARNDRLKELGEMAAMVAHEIRNPLGGIKGFASLLERDLKEMPELAKMAGYIIEGTNTLNRLVGTVLNYSRPLQLKFEPTNLVDLMKELIEHIRADSSINLAIELELKAAKPEIITAVDPASIKSAVLNLVVNSIQAMPEGGKVQIKILTEHNLAIIQIKDNGIGIPPENMEKLFSPFFTTRSEGNGFGLAEVYKVMQAHGGTVEATSELGRGATFALKLPFIQSTQNGH